MEELPIGGVWSSPLEALATPFVAACLKAIVLGDSGEKHLEIPTPSTWQEALGGEHAQEWLESMQIELEGLLSRGSFKQVPCSEAKNIIKCKWVYRIKRRRDGQPHFKSRLVAKG